METVLFAPPRSSGDGGVVASSLNVTDKHLRRVEGRGPTPESANFVSVRC